MYDFLSYRPVSEDDAELLLDWRTAPHITQYMLSDVPYECPPLSARWLYRFVVLPPAPRAQS